MINEKVKPTGEVTLVLKDENGNIKSTHVVNMIVNTGLSFFTSRLIGVASAVMSHIAVGTGAVAAAKADALLGAEIARQALSSSVQSTTTVSNDAVTYTATLAAGIGTGALTEAGLFNIGTANTGTMAARTVFPVVNKGASDVLTISWKITFS